MHLFKTLSGQSLDLASKASIEYCLCITRTIDTNETRAPMTWLNAGFDTSEYGTSQDSTGSNGDLIPQLPSHLLEGIMNQHNQHSQRPTSNKLVEQVSKMGMGLFQVPSFIFSSHARCRNLRACTIFRWLHAKRHSHLKKSWQEYHLPLCLIQNLLRSESSF